MVRNELARLVGPGAEYRADQEAGVTGRRPRDLLIATSGAQRVIRSPVADGDRPGVSRFRESGSCPARRGATHGETRKFPEQV